MSQKESVSTSWADESDDIEESTPKTKESNAWAKGNPWGITAPKGNEGRESGLNDFPPAKAYNEKESKRDDKGGYDRDDGRSGGPPYGRKEDNYGPRGDHPPPSRDYQSNRDYPSNRENYRRESSGYGKEGREGYNREDNRGFRDYPREDRNYPREDRNYGREDRPFRDYQKREDNDRQRPHRTERAPRDPVPFPDQPPYTAFIGNLSFDITEEDLISFFGTECKVDNVRLLINRETNKPKGFGYVQFKDLDSLKTAVAQNGEALLDRPLRIDVAEAKPDERTGGSRGWGNRSTERPPKSFNAPSFSSSGSFQRGDAEESQRERPKLELKPRSETSPKQPNEPGVVYQGAKSNPFGEAKPRDESLFLKKVEEKKAPSQSDTKKIDQLEEKEERSPKVTSPSREVNTNEPSNPPPRHNSHDSRERRSPQKRDNGEDKPFVRGSNSRGRGERNDRGGERNDRGGDRRGDRGGFRKDERNFPRGGERPKEKTTERSVKPLTQEATKLDVTSTNLFSALEEEEN